MRLIDADALNNALEDKLFGIEAQNAITIVDEQLTAYDVDEKIKQLQKLAGNGHHDTLFDHKWNLFLRANKVYNIVKGGGTDDDK